MNISIAKDFSDAPWGRTPDDSVFCGANFRDQKLFPALKGNEMVVVSLDGVEGLGSSFLDEAFGGLVRIHKFTANQLKAKLLVETTEPRLELYVQLIWEYIEEAARDLIAA
jgi:hypothetical protein